MTNCGTRARSEVDCVDPPEKASVRSTGRTRTQNATKATTRLWMKARHGPGQSVYQGCLRLNEFCVVHPAPLQRTCLRTSSTEQRTGVNRPPGWQTVEYVWRGNKTHPMEGGGSTWSHTASLKRSWRMWTAMMGTKTCRHHFHLRHHNHHSQPFNDH